jgi:hypothetical protein
VSPDLRRWIVDDLTSARARLANGVLALIPPERCAETVDGGGIPAVYVIWHMTRHHDVAVNSVLRGADQVLASHTAAVGVEDRVYRGLAEGADLDLVSVLDPEAVSAYALATIDETIDWVSTEADLDNLDAVPDALAALDAMGTPTDTFDWLYRMWDGKPNRWFLSWEAVGHIVTHTGELVSIRNRMGLSPF